MMQNQIILQGITSDQLLSKIEEIVKNNIEAQTQKLRKSKFSDKEYLEGKEVEELLNISAPTRYSWEKKGLFTRYKIAGQTRYKTSEILGALEKINNSQ